MTDVVDSKLVVPDRAPDLFFPDNKQAVARMQEPREAMSETMSTTHAAAVRSEQVAEEYAVSGLSLDARLANFETFLLQKVKAEVLAHQAQPPTHVGGVIEPAITLTTPGADGLARPDKAARQAQVHQRIAGEALRAKTAALEQRQSVLEGKLNALVSDFVLTNQANHNEMRTFGDSLRLQLRRHKEVVQQQLAGVASATGSAAPSGPLAEARMGEMVKVIALVDERTRETQSSLDAAEEQWLQLMSRMVEKMGELTVRIGQLEADTPARGDAPYEGTDGQSLSAAVGPTVQTHLRVVEEAMCQFADDLENLRSEVRTRASKPLVGARSPPRSQARAVAQLLATQQQRLVRARFFQSWKKVTEDKLRNERDEMVLSVLRAHQEEINRLKERVGERTAAPKQSAPPKGASVKELQKCIRVAVADRSNPPSVHVCRTLQAFGAWAEQVDHCLHTGSA